MTPNILLQAAEKPGTVLTIASVTFVALAFIYLIKLVWDVFHYLFVDPRDRWRSEIHQGWREGYLGLYPSYFVIPLLMGVCVLVMIFSGLFQFIF